jgi:hypothetical protein
VREMEGGAGLDSLRPAALKKLLSILKVPFRITARCVGCCEVFG